MNLSTRFNRLFWPRYIALKYRLKLSLFHWVQDEDGDIGLNILNILTFLKYKESTILLWGTRKRHSLIPAPKRIYL